MARKKTKNLSIKEQLDNIKDEITSTMTKMEAAKSTYDKYKKELDELEVRQSQKVLELIKENRKLAGKDDSISEIISDISSNNEQLKTNNYNQNN